MKHFPASLMESCRQSLRPVLMLPMLNSNNVMSDEESLEPGLHKVI